MGRIKRDKADIDYNVYGSGDTTLLFVHGSFFDQEYWQSQVDYFKTEYRVATLDLPGHGKSGRERERWSVEGFAEDVTAVIDALDSDKVILIGHSLAGDVNLIAATLHPESIIGFIGIDTFKNAATPLPEPYRDLANAILESQKIDFSGTNEQFARTALLTRLTPPGLVDRVVRAYREGYPPMGQAILPEVFEIHKLEREFLPRLETKLYLINAEYIPTKEEPLKQFARNGYEVVRIPGTCHYPMLENPASLNVALERVIDKIRKENEVAA